ncbi:MAG TPA: LysR family transcriptional regulator [Candidatus Mediterraneibacter norfolkensis]|nr:LysR family transcriptional regulator [Candidatus Mediterraneibacter norfolkensis]
MLFRQMKYFTAVVDCNSFTEAAEQCYISQSAISQQIRALEKDLGVELIHRENRRFSLMPAGEYFYNQSKGLLDEVEDIRRETIRIGQDEELQLRIGYLRCYSGQELHQAVAEFSQMYPEVSISIVNGTHEELYDLLRFGGVDLVLNDQRRAFSDKYANYQLLQCGCYAELSVRNRLSSQDSVDLEDLKHSACILISSREQQNTEEEYFRNTLGFGGRFLFAESLEEGRLMVAGNRGFLPIESVGTLPPAGASIRRLPIMQNGQQLRRNYCVFWVKEQTNYYIEEFAGLLKKLLHEEKQA